MANRILKGLQKENEYFVKGSIWLECNGERFFGPGPVELLELIQTTGSINKAAREMKMSYKKAWEIISSLNTDSGRPFVLTQTGGKSGGGSVVTDEAKTFIVWYRQLRERFAAFLEKETNKVNR